MQRMRLWMWAPLALAVACPAVAGVQSDAIGIIPVGAYPDVLSPLGLLDVSGGGNQHTEEISDQIFFNRIAVGSEPGQFEPFELLDSLGFHGTAGGGGGLRIASAIPTPGALTPPGSLSPA